MKSIIKYIFINRIFLVVIALFCTTLIPFLRNPIDRGNLRDFDIAQGNGERYLYLEPQPMYQNMWSVWDTKWYVSIAEAGYSRQRYPFAEIDNKGFMPLYPLLMWLVSTSVLFGHTNLAGFLVSNLFLILSFYILGKFIDSEEKIRSKVHIDNAFLYLLYFPTSYYLSSIYPESLFLFLSILSLYLINKKKIVWAGVAIGLASITKVFGIFLLIPMAFYLIKHRHAVPLKKLLLCILATAIFPLTYLWYMYRISGDAFAYLDIQKAFFAHAWSNPFVNMYQELFVHISAQGLFHGAATVFGLIVLFLGRKLIRIEHLLYTLACLLFTPLTGSTNGNARYIASFFFIPLILSMIIKKENTKMIFISALSFIQGLVFIWWLTGAGFAS